MSRISVRLTNPYISTSLEYSGDNRQGGKRGTLGLVAAERPKHENPCCM